MGKKVCVIKGCRQPVHGRGWCRMHYTRWKRTGTPSEDVPARRWTQSVPERFWSKVDTRGPDECWPWRPPVRPDGYGSFHRDGRGVPAHRVAYELEVGPVPDGLDVDHECHNRDESCPGGPCAHRACCNPAHLKPATRRANLLGGRTVVAAHARATHCPAGHPYDDANTYVAPSGHRFCRACKHERRRAS
jgi:HNH endonuclease